MTALDELLKELRRLGDELGAILSPSDPRRAEQARVNKDDYGLQRCDRCGGSYFKKHFSTHNCKHIPSKPTPAVERFVMWDYPEHFVVSNTIGRSTVPISYYRIKRGDVVATPPGLAVDSFPYWYVDFASGDTLILDKDDYQTLKDNGCFGERVE